MLVFFFFLSVLACWASEAKIVENFNPDKPEPLCTADGQYLLLGGNRCKYLRCTYGPEPWKDADGNTQFYAVERQCPYGTAIARAAYTPGYNAALDERRLCADRVAAHHGGVRYYDPCSVKYPRNGGYNTHPVQYESYPQIPRTEPKLETELKTYPSIQKPVAKPAKIAEPRSRYSSFNPYSAPNFPAYPVGNRMNSHSFFAYRPYPAAYPSYHPYGGSYPFYQGYNYPGYYQEAEATPEQEAEPEAEIQAVEEVDGEPEEVGEAEVEVEPEVESETEPEAAIENNPEEEASD